MKKSVVVFGEAQILTGLRKPRILRNLAYFLSVQPLTVSIETELGLRKLARRAALRDIDEAIRTEKFPVYDGPTKAAYWLIRFPRVLSGPDVRRVLAALEFQPATLRETLSFWERLSPRKRRRLLRRLDLVALGSQLRHRHYDERRPDECVFYLGRWNRCHRLKLSDGISFTRHDCFLVRATLPEA